MATFATAIACIDGRIHAPLSTWVRRHLGVDHMDLVTEPGADRVCARGDDRHLRAILDRVEISAVAHASSTIVIAGHADCAAHPVDPDRHHADIRLSLRRLRPQAVGKTLIGVWVDEHGEVVEVDVDTPVGMAS
jgi:hypothetical protein